MSCIAASSAMQHLLVIFNYSNPSVNFVAEAVAYMRRFDRANDQFPSGSQVASRPRYLNLFQIRMPLPAIVSIMHRVSGAALFFALPLVLWGLQLSLTSGRTFAEFQTLFSSPIVKLLTVALLWGYLHHLCAGLRHVVMDLHYGLELRMVRLSSMLVLAVSVTLTAVIGARLW